MSYEELNSYLRKWQSEGLAVTCDPDLFPLNLTRGLHFNGLMGLVNGEWRRRGSQA